MAGPDSIRPNAGAHLGSGQYFGQVLAKRDCCDLILAEVQHTQAKSFSNHTHQLAFFSFLLDGSYTEYCGSKPIEYAQLGVVFRGPELIHSDKIGQTGVRLFNIELKNSWLERARQYARIKDFSIQPNRGELAWLTAKLYREFKDQDPCSTLAIEGLALEMIALLCRDSSTVDKQAPAWLQKAQSLLRAEFNQNISISRVAEEVGVHPLYLSRMFRKFHNQTIAEHVQALRVESASRQLLNPEADLASVALATGFTDQSHFNRIFKRVTGMTPGAFRIAFSVKTYTDDSQRDKR